MTMAVLFGTAGSGPAQAGDLTRKCRYAGGGGGCGMAGGGTGLERSDCPMLRELSLSRGLGLACSNVKGKRLF